MASKRKRVASHAQRLEKGLSKAKADARPGRARKGALRPKPRRHSRRTVGAKRHLSPLARLMGALQAQEIAFQLVGMSAAVLQGVPVATFDVDLWLNLPERQYMRAVRVALAYGAQLVRNTVVELSDGTLVNFIFQVTGLGAFEAEMRRARRLRFHGLTVAVMPLESIRKSKAAIMRPKDEAHIHYLDETLRAWRMERRGK